MHMQGQSAWKSFEHHPNVGTQKLHIMTWCGTQGNCLEFFINVLDARIGEFGKNTQGRMSKATSICVQTNHWKEKLFDMLDVTYQSKKENFMGVWVSQVEAKTACLQTNKMK